MKKILLQKLNRYDEIAKGISKSIKPLAKTSLALSGAFMAAIPVTEGAVVYSGLQNIAMTPGVSKIIDFNGGAGDMSFKFNAGPANAFFYMQGSATAAVGAPIGGTNYANALSSADVIDAGDPFIAAGSFSMSYNGSGPWGGLPATGTERYVGVRLSISGNTHYGWVRLKKSSGPAYTIVDWAYDDVMNTSITPATSLPVEMLSFEAIVEAQTVSLNWKTASEENNLGFEVQRSTNGLKFEKLDFVEGNGTSLSISEYFYDDNDLKGNEKYYYRLKQIDFNGQFEYSDVITAKVEGKSADVGNFYPNPTNGVTRLNYTATQNTDLIISAYNVNGQELLSETRTVTEGLNNLELDYSKLSTGTYFVKLQNGEDVQYQKLIID
jgi:hypothetical protein